MFRKLFAFFRLLLFCFSQFLFFKLWVTIARIQNGNFRTHTLGRMFVISELNFQIWIILGCICVVETPLQRFRVIRSLSFGAFWCTFVQEFAIIKEWIVSYCLFALFLFFLHREMWIYGFAFYEHNKKQLKASKTKKQKIFSILKSFVYFDGMAWHSSRLYVLHVRKNELLLSASLQIICRHFKLQLIFFFHISFIFCSNTTMIIIVALSTDSLVIQSFQSPILTS